MKVKLKVDEIVKTENGNNLFQYLCTIAGTLAILSSSMHSAWPTPSLPQLLGNSSHISVTNSEGSWVSVLMFLGCPLGSILAFLIVDTLGRKKVLLLTAPPLMAAWIALAYAEVVEIIYVARFIAGVADGAAYTVMPMYLGEIADPKIRGLLGSSTSVSNMIGILLVNTLAIFFNIRTASLISATIPLLFIATFTWVPESPYFLIMTDQKEVARNNLMLLTGRDNVDKHMSRLLKAADSNASRKPNILDLFKMKNNRRGLLIVIGLRTFQQLSGFTAITIYAQVLFDKIHGIVPSNIMTIIYFLIQFTFTVMSSVLLDKVGRKPLLITSVVGCILFLVLQGTYYLIDERTDLSHLNLIPILSLMLFVIFYSLGMSTITNVMLGELFPTNIKAFALCLTEIYYGIIATVVSKFFQIIKDEFGFYIPFYVFASSGVFAIFFIIHYIPETKGKTLEEIQEHLSGSKTEELEENREENV